MKYAIAALIFVVACRPQTSASVEDAQVSDTSAAATSASAYADVADFLSTGDEAWVAASNTLAQDFGDICGDTYCGGDYSNLTAIRLRCSLNTTTQILKSCKLVFAGSYETVNTQTGSIKVTAKTFSCPITVTNLKLGDFLSTVNATGPEPALQRPLPNGLPSVYDSIGDCLP